MKGPPENLRERAAAGFAKRYGVAVDDLSVRDGFLGLEVPGASDRGGPAGAPRRDRARAPVHEVDDVGRRFPVRAAGALALRQARRRDRRGAARRRAERRHLVRPPRDASGAGRDPLGRRATSRRCAPQASSRTAPCATSASSRGSTRSAPWSDPLGKLDEVVYLVEKADVLAGSFDERFLRLPERVVVDDDAVAPALLPARRQPLRVRRERRRPRRRARRQRVRALGPARGCGVHVRARRRDRDRRARRADQRRSRSSPAAARSRTRPSASPSSSSSSEATTSAVQAARLAKADQAAELVREFSELEGHIGATYARLAGYGDERRAGDRRAVPAGQRGRAAAATRGRRDPRRRRQARHPAGRVRARQAPDRLARPVRAASRRDRPVQARDRRRRPRRAVAASGRRARFRRGAARRACSTCRSSSSVRRAPRRSPISAASHGCAGAARSRAKRRVRGGVRGVRPRRSDSPASATTPPRTVDPKLFEHDTERELADAVAGLELDPGDVPGSLAAGRDGRTDRLALLRRRDGGRRRRCRARQPPAAAARRARPRSGGSATSRRSRVVAASRARRRRTRAPRCGRSRRARARRSCSSAGSNTCRSASSCRR